MHVLAWFTLVLLIVSQLGVIFHVFLVSLSRVLLHAMC